jgi:hypothetical protein
MVSIETAVINREPGLVAPRAAMAVLSHIGPDFSMEDAMRALFPAEAERIYDPGRWPAGAPKEDRQ